MSALDRDQLIAELLAERSFSRQHYANGGAIDLRSGATAMHGRALTPVGTLRSTRARQAGYTEADARAEAERLADEIIAEDNELIGDMAAASPRGPGRPPKPDADRRTRRLVLLATEAEAAAILARIPAGQEFSDWARERLLGE